MWHRGKNMPFKIVIIGGGSYNWAPTIINDIVLTSALDGSRIVLEDIAAEPLKALHSLGLKMVSERNSGCTIHWTTDEAEALEGADFVIVTISTGGFETMAHDLEIPARFGVNQTVGDTVGPGGLARALRSIPVQVGIARHMEQLCPTAWLINYTNPMSTLCLAINQTTAIHAIGLCHELQGVLHILKSMFGLREDCRLDFEVAGVNHFIWLLNLAVNGADGFDMLRRWMRNPTPFSVQDEEIKEMFSPSTIDRAKLKLELFQKFGCLPAAGDRHLAEFFDCYLRDFAEVEQRYGIKPTSIKERSESWLAAMQGYVNGMLKEYFPLPQSKSEEKVSDILAALGGVTEPIIDIINLPNRGQIENLPTGCIVETMGKISRGSAEPLSPVKLAERIRKLVMPHAENQFLTVKAALEGDRAAALEVLRRDPLCRNCTNREKMLDELLEAHRAYLPRFWK
jgi:alpha-galactosidase